MKLLTIELKKVLTYKTFWIIIGLYFLFLCLGKRCGRIFQ